MFEVVDVAGAPIPKLKPEKIRGEGKGGVGLPKSPMSPRIKKKKEKKEKGGGEEGMA